MFELKKYCYKLYKMVKSKSVKKIPKLDVPTIGIIVVSVAIIIVLVSNFYKKVKREGFKLLNIQPGDFKTDGIAKNQYSFPVNQRIDVINKMISIVKDTKTKESQDFINWTLANSLPKGSIILWYGEESTIPKGWAICDGKVIGKHQTWKLTDRFMVGIGSGAKNGHVKGTMYNNDGKGKLTQTESVTLDANSLPLHNHVATIKISDRGHKHPDANTSSTSVSILAINDSDSKSYNGFRQGDNDGPRDGHYRAHYPHKHKFVSAGSNSKPKITATLGYSGSTTPFSINYTPPLGYLGVYYIEKIV